MGVMIQIRNVPAELHRTFKARAATAGMSMSEYLLGELRGLAERPSMETMRARLAALPETEITTAEIMDALDRLVALSEEAGGYDLPAAVAIGYLSKAAMNTSAGIRIKRPVHPGGFVRHEIIEPLGLSVTRAAEALGVTRATLSTLLNESAHPSPDMAVRIEKAFGVSMDTLMRMRNSWGHRPGAGAGGADGGGVIRRGG